MKLLIVEVPLFPCYFIPLRHTHSPHRLGLKHPQSVFFHEGEKPRFKHIQKLVKLIIISLTEKYVIRYQFYVPCFYCV